jgi:hypothetical protein
MKYKVLSLIAAVAFGIGMFNYPPPQTAHAQIADPNFVVTVENVGLTPTRVVMSMELSYLGDVVHTQNVSQTYTARLGLTIDIRNALRDKIQIICDKQRNVVYQSLRPGYFLAPGVITNQIKLED